MVMNLSRLPKTLIISTSRPFHVKGSACSNIGERKGCCLVGKANTFTPVYMQPTPLSRFKFKVSTFLPATATTASAAIKTSQAVDVHEMLSTTCGSKSELNHHKISLFPVARDHGLYEGDNHVYLSDRLLSQLSRDACDGSELSEILVKEDNQRLSSLSCSSFYNNLELGLSRQQLSNLLSRQANNSILLQQKQNSELKTSTITKRSFATLNGSRSIQYLKKSKRLLYVEHHHQQLNRHTDTCYKMLQVQNLANRLITRFISSTNAKLFNLTQTFTNLNKSTGTHATGPATNSDLDLSCIKTITVNACGELYNALSVSKPSLYKNAPKGRGIDFKIEYYDNEKLIDKSSICGTVCIFHGAPGHYKEFSSLINHLTTKNIRVVAPNFPNYELTLEHSFRHSPPERVDLLMNFFKNIKLTKIDMAIAHSGAVYTILKLLEETFSNLERQDKLKIQIISLGLFSTPTYNLPANLAATPIRMFTLQLYEYPILRSFIKATIELFVKIQGIRNRVDKNNIENLLTAASVVGYSNSETSKETLTLIREKKVPVFVLYGLKDSLIPPSSFEQLKKDLNIQSSSSTKKKQVRCYDGSGKLIHEVSEADLNDLVEVSEFASGGHYVFQRYASQVNEDVYNFLKRKVLTMREETRL